MFFAESDIVIIPFLASGGYVFFSMSFPTISLLAFSMALLNTWVIYGGPPKDKCFKTLWYQAIRHLDLYLLPLFIFGVKSLFYVQPAPEAAMSNKTLLFYVVMALSMTYLIVMNSILNLLNENYCFEICCVIDHM